MHHQCITSASSVHHQCIISASSVYHQCIIEASSLAHYPRVLHCLLCLVSNIFCLAKRYFSSSECSRSHKNLKKILLFYNFSVKKYRSFKMFTAWLTPALTKVLFFFLLLFSLLPNYFAWSKNIFLFQNVHNKFCRMGSFQAVWRCFCLGWHPF